MSRERPTHDPDPETEQPPSSPAADLLLAEMRALAALMPGLPGGPVAKEADEADFDNMPV
ncbi:MAG TPA: hypothetical protein PKD10_19520 [Paracoccaceae bacterium]|nr:hypothetical protein [Paracoccaceae bacterium]HMO71905.1 hypothetical protein [Paracoccaceae bacterium]